MKYKITGARFDRPERTIFTFDASDDMKAGSTFAEFKDMREYSWERLTLKRVDQEEILTELEVRG